MCLSLRALKPRSAAYPDGLHTIGDHIRTIRLNRGLLQKEAALFIGVNTMTLWGWENYQREPTIRLWKGIIHFLGYYPFAQEKLEEKLLAYRRTHGLSQEELASRLGVDPQSVARWETGKEPQGERCNQAIEKLLDSTMQGGIGEPGGG